MEVESGRWVGEEMMLGLDGRMAEEKRKKWYVKHIFYLCASAVHIL